MRGAREPRGTGAPRESEEAAGTALVEREVTFRLTLSPGRGTPVRSLLRYRPDDPYAVHVTFHLGTERPVHWTFARELLVEGLLRPTGQGDVRLWPSAADGRSVLHLALSSWDGDVLLAAPARPVRDWLERTLQAVPRGREHGRVALEDELHAVLAASPDDR